MRIHLLDNRKRRGRKDRDKYDGNHANQEELDLFAVIVP